MLQKETLSKIKASENRFRELFKHMSSGVAIYKAVDDGSDFIFKDLNRVAEKIDKIKRKDVVGKSVLKVFPEVKDFGLYDVFKRVYETGKPERYPVLFYKDNRISGWRRNYVYRLPSDEIVTVYDDMTRQKQTEESLKISEEFSASLMENSPTPVEVLNADCSLKYMNSALEKLVRIGSKILLGKKPPFPWWSEDMGKKCAELFKEFSEKKTYLSSFPILIKGRETRYANVIATPVRKGGKLKYILINYVDITNQKKSEEEQRENGKRLKRILESTINALSSIMKTKDPYTYGHQRRVCKLAVSIAEDLGLEESRVEAVRIAAKIHDIGKINIPASVLNKPGRLTDIEYSLIKTHSQMSYEMVKEIEFPMPIAEIILQHHEKLDGSGYPRGLKEKDIMLEAKILTVADVVEAISSDRPYRPALGLNVAIEEISKNRGKLYDPVVVDSCIKLVTQKGFKFD